MPSAQLALEFDHRPALSGEDFLVAPSNAAAVAWIDRWPDWPGPALVLHGPAGCGKSHLAAVFRQATGALALTPAGLNVGLPDVAPGAAVVIEDVDGDALSEASEALFHLYNRIVEAGGGLLLTARTPPARWEFQLADLASRLRAAAAVDIGPPDDDLMSAVLVKLFADRQLRVDVDVIHYLVRHMERSFDAARRIVAEADALALAERRAVTVPLMRRLLGDAESTD